MENETWEIITTISEGVSFFTSPCFIATYSGLQQTEWSDLPEYVQEMLGLLQRVSAEVGGIDRFHAFRSPAGRKIYFLDYTYEGKDANKSHFVIIE